MKQYDELAARCEQATRPSRHLDTQIFILLDPDAQHIVGKKPGPFPQEAIYGPRSSYWDWACDESKEPPQFADIPRYTASLDAAMTLVPEGWHVRKLCEGPNVTPRPRDFAYDGTWSVELHYTGGPRFHNLVWGAGNSAALALTAAALRARSQEK